MEHIVGSSHGNFTIDTDGYIIERRIDNKDSDDGSHLAHITRFDLAEWRHVWSNPNQTEIDILDLGYWYKDPATNKSIYVTPDTDWRKEIAEILLQRKRAARIRDAAPKLLDSLEKVLDSLCYWLPRYGHTEIVNSKMVIDARSAIAEATSSAT